MLHATLNGIEVRHPRANRKRMPSVQTLSMFELDLRRNLWE